MADVDDTRSSWSATVIDGPDRGRVWSIDDIVVMGSGADCALRLNDAGVSLRHATIERDRGGLRLVDLDSEGGTWLGGTRLRDVVLTGGETIRIGGTTLTLSPAASGVPPSAEPPDFLDRVVTSGQTFTAARDQVVDEFRRRYVEHMLHLHGGNVTRAAAASGIGRRYFQMVRGKV